MDLERDWLVELMVDLDLMVEVAAVAVVPLVVVVLKELAQVLVEVVSWWDELPDHVAVRSSP